MEAANNPPDGSPSFERRHWPRLPLAIPVFVRGVDKQGKEFLEFSTLLNESAGGALLAIRRFLQRWSQISLEIPSSPVLKQGALPSTVRKLRARVVRTSFLNGWNLCGLQFIQPLTQV